MLDAISNRRSIRAYKDLPIPKPVLEQILQAGTLAPSSKNRQPWKFTVVSGASKQAMLSVMEQGLAREKGSPLLPGSRQHLPGAEYTLEIIKKAPVTIFIMNTLGIPFSASLTPEQRVYEICNAQSIGAAIENMALTATELGLGSLWVCDTFFAYEELKSWLDSEGELFAALTLGYADESPLPRPRKKKEAITEWRS
jgi:nitroreductase